MMGLNYYEKTLVKVLTANPNINTRKFIDLSGLGKTSFYKYAKRLEASGYISNKQVKNQFVWHVPRRDKRHDLGLSEITESRVLEKRYQKIESLVLKGIRKVKGGNMSEKIDAYGSAVVLVLSTLDSMNLVMTYRKGHVPDYYIQHAKKLENLLARISNERFFSDYGFGRVAIDAIAYDAESQLCKFLGIDPDEGKKTFIY